MATTQNFNYPSSSDVTVTGIGTPNGQPIPSSSVLIAGEDPSGNQHVVQTDANGDLLVSPLTTASTVTVVQPTGTNLHAVIDSSALPTGASTSALQTSGNTTLTTISTTAASILLDLTNGTQITQITGTVPLPTGAATAANQTTEISSLATIATNTTGVSTAANQTTGNTSLATIATNTTGVSTAALQTSGNASLTTIATNSGTQATAANQATGNTSLASIATNQTSGGNKVQLFTPTALTITQAAITVGTTAVRLTPSGSAPASTRVSLVATPDAASTGKFYIGSSSVTATGATRGIQIVAGQSFIANNDAGDYFIISDTAAQTVEVLSQG